MENLSSIHPRNLIFLLTLPWLSLFSVSRVAVFHSQMTKRSMKTGRGTGTRNNVIENHGHWKEVDRARRKILIFFGIHHSLSADSSH
ncbi:hypothetical protein D9758_017491 [Tetrapyrgos nigripes]|uniref:Uncharacterized protein n=1 Tax=Tetrapyrgos nigripes TaxID=182062 RepID=A0A8H5C4E2_9AGAR|nr:hypothetical protein D9758_017491 [Tetrapyrgos nigripes]